MVYLKIKNVYNEGTTIVDYKGLDSNLISVNTPLYPSEKNECYLGYLGEIPKANDIEVLTEQEYLELREIVLLDRPKLEVEVLKERVQQLELMQMETLQILAAITSGGVE